MLLELFLKHYDTSTYTCAAYRQWWPRRTIWLFSYTCPSLLVAILKWYQGMLLADRFNCVLFFLANTMSEWNYEPNSPNYSEVLTQIKSTKVMCLYQYITLQVCYNAWGLKKELECNGASGSVQVFASPLASFLTEYFSWHFTQKFTCLIKDI